MRWWLQTNPPYLMGVDNASVTGMDYSALLATEPDLWMVQWTEGKGEIERVEIDANNEASNLNGLRESFIDITPYAPFFQQFLTLMQAKNLLLPQAKKVQCDLIGEVFNAKRQEPFYYPVAAGDYSWDATDATLFSSTVPAIQNAIAKINEVVDRLNAQFPALDAADTSVASQANTAAISIVTQANSNVVTAGNTACGAINSNVVSGGNTLVNQVQVNVVNQGNVIRGQLQSWCATTAFDFGGDPAISFTAAAPGLYADYLEYFLNVDDYFSDIGTDYFSALVSPTVSAPNTLWTPMSSVTTTNLNWIPVGMSTPVEVTPTEAGAIMTGIAARTNDLQSKKAAKQAAVNALTTVPAVIAYDVTTGW